jgi:hypothetical protein
MSNTCSVYMPTFPTLAGPKKPKLLDMAGGSGTHPYGDSINEGDVAWPVYRECQVTLEGPHRAAASRTVSAADTGTEWLPGRVLLHGHSQPPSDTLAPAQSTKTYHPGLAMALDSSETDTGGVLLTHGLPGGGG